MATVGDRVMAEKKAPTVLQEFRAMKLARLMSIRESKWSSIGQEGRQMRAKKKSVNGNKPHGPKLRAKG